MAAPLSQQDFVTRSNKSWGGRWLYQRAVYRSSTLPVTVTCSVHGDFEVNARQHLLGKAGCPTCYSNERHLSYEQFLVKAKAKFGDRFRYSDVQWGDGRIVFYCVKHGEQTAIWFNHLSGKGCAKCSRERSQFTATEVQSRLVSLGFKGRLIPESYVSTVASARFECPDHGEQIGWPGNLLKGQRLKCCFVAARVSLFEKDVFDFLAALESSFEASNSTVLGGFEIDAYSDKFKVGVESNGDYWHSEESVRLRRGESARTYHARKKAIAKRAGVTLVFVWESDWAKRRSTVEGALKRLLAEGYVDPILSRLE